MTIRLVIADDHPLILNGIEELFAAETDFELAAKNHHRCGNPRGRISAPA